MPFGETWLTKSHQQGNLRLELIDVILHFVGEIGNSVELPLFEEFRGLRKLSEPLHDPLLTLDGIDVLEGTIEPILFELEPLMDRVPKIGVGAEVFLHGKNLRVVLDLHLK